LPGLKDSNVGAFRILLHHHNLLCRRYGIGTGIETAGARERMVLAQFRPEGKLKRLIQLCLLMAGTLFATTVVVADTRVQLERPALTSPLPQASGTLKLKQDLPCSRALRARFKNPVQCSSRRKEALIKAEILEKRRHLSLLASAATFLRHALNSSNMRWRNLGNMYTGTK